MSAATAFPSVPPEALSDPPYSFILCYPTPSETEARARVLELQALGVREILFRGHARLGNLNIIGKGCVALVVEALTQDGPAAVKIRRVDANRPDMEREAMLQRLANSADVGPRLLKASKNFLVMELVSGSRIVDWLRALKGRGSAALVRRTLADVLKQCYRLDRVGLDHGELSNLSKHLVIADRPVILDFETASIGRRPANVTASAQFLFIGGPVARSLRRMLSLRQIEPLIDALREYKRRQSDESFSNLLAELHLTKR